MTNTYDGEHFQVALMNMRDGSVQGHAAGCADLKRGLKKFAEPEQANDVWDVRCKEDAREGYNADFDEETDGWYDIEWLPCAKHIPAQLEVTEETPAEQPFATGVLPQAGSVKIGAKWTYLYAEDGSLIAELRNDQFAAISAFLTKS